VILSPKERNLAIGAGAGILLLIAYFYVIAPYIIERQQIEGDLQTARDAQASASQNLKLQKTMTPVWLNLKENGGLKVDPTLSSLQARYELNDWADKSGVLLLDVGEKPADVGKFTNAKFQQQVFNVTGTGSQWNIENFMWAIENAPIPLRLSEVQITPQKEDTNDLTVHLIVSALCLTSDTSAPASQPAAALAAEPKP
jgi:hypothetical protein